MKKNSEFVSIERNVLIAKGQKLDKIFFCAKNFVKIWARHRDVQAVVSIYQCDQIVILFYNI